MTMETTPRTSRRAQAEAAFADLAAEFGRATFALTAAMTEGDQGDRMMPFYRLRDVALATEDLMCALLDAAGVEPGGSLSERMRRVVGDDPHVLGAVETLAGLKSAHTLSFLKTPPVATLEAGHAAAVTVAAFVDALFGDRYTRRAAP
ncbi:MAG: hypothetical protein KC417_12505 [Myxococcales bacterium]|nr:hypothetical protein [Myxococcales bacterium]